MLAQKSQGQDSQPRQGPRYQEAAPTSDAEADVNYSQLDHYRQQGWSESRPGFKDDLLAKEARARQPAPAPRPSLLTRIITSFKRLFR